MYFFREREREIVHKPGKRQAEEEEEVSSLKRDSIPDAPSTELPPPQHPSPELLNSQLIDYVSSGTGTYACAYPRTARPTAEVQAPPPQQCL